MWMLQFHREPETIRIHAGANVTTNNRGTYAPQDALDQLLVLFGRVSTNLGVQNTNIQLKLMVVLGSYFQKVDLNSRNTRILFSDFFSSVFLEIDTLQLQKQNILKLFSFHENCF